MTQPNDWWELTNEQRRCFGIAPVGAEWRCLRLPRSKYDDYDTALYLDGCQVRYMVRHGEMLHSEHVMDETLTEDGQFIVPKRSAKPIKLSAATIVKRKPVGMYLSFAKYPQSSGAVCLNNATCAQSFYSNWTAGGAVDSMEQFRQWVEDWCADTTEADQREIDEFAARTMQTVKHREGDVFRFRWNRRLWGYGRILLDYDLMRRKKIPFYDCMMCRPVVIEVFKIVTENRDLPVSEVLAAESLPGQNMMDDGLHYGEFEIIGNAELPEDRDARCPIMYGTGPRFDGVLRFQQGRIYREIPGGKAIGGRRYLNNAVGWGIDITLPQMCRCIREGSAAYWTLTNWKTQADLRSPANAADQAAVRKQMGV